MKQATVKLPSGEFCFQGVHKGAQLISVVDGIEICYWYADGYEWADSIYIRPGSWQLLGADPTRLTEVEAGEIVEENFDGCFFKDYIGFNEPLKNYYFGKDTAVESLDSLAASLGIEKPFVVLKNI